MAIHRDCESNQDKMTLFSKRRGRMAIHRDCESNQDKMTLLRNRKGPDGLHRKRKIRLRRERDKR